MDNSLLLFIFLLMSIMSLFMTYLIYLIKTNDGLRRLFMMFNIIILVYGSIRLHHFWQGPSWMQWTLSLMIPVAAYAVFGLFILFVDVIITRRFAAISYDVMRALDSIKHFIPNLRQDFWQFVQFCIIDEEDEATTQLFNIG